MPIFNFTKQQRDILMHRMDVYDCIAEANELDEIVVKEVCDRWKVSLNKSLQVEVINQTEADILTDCFEGCTYFATFHPYFGSKQRFVNVHTSFKSKGQMVFNELLKAGFEVPLIANVQRDVW